MKESEERICPTCQSPIAPDSPEGLCPKCLLEGAETASVETAADRRKPAAPDLETIGRAFPELEILELVGVGGMGAVYKARQPRLDRMVALKVLASDLADSPAFTERFNREAKVLAFLNHPNIVSIYDFGERDGLLYLMMEFIDGVNLRQAMQAGQFSADEALRVIPDICQALQFAHNEGVLHRDIKPENILLDTCGAVKIVDFGIAKLIGKQREEITLTGEGSVLGSPHYMAPEQLKRPKEVDHRADIYSLGVVFYEMLTGELPVGRFGPPSEQTPVDSRVDDVVMRTLERERQRRYQSAEELKHSVEALTAHGDPDPARQANQPANQQTERSTQSDVVAGANLSAVLTTCGLGLLLVWCFEFVYITSLEPNNSGFSVMFWAFAALILVLMALGFIFGAKGLRTIRHSGGLLRGLVRCLYGTLAVPLSILIVLLAIGSGMALISVFGPGFAWIIGATIVTTAVGSSFIVGAWRWAKGNAWEGRPSDELATVSAVATVVILLPTLAVLLIWAMLTLSRSESRSSGNSGATEAHATRQDKTIWNLGKPEVAFDLTIPAGQAATFQLVRLIGGEVVERTNLKGFIVAASNEDYNGRVQLGSLMHMERADGSKGWIIRVSGAKGGQGISSGDLEGNWNYSIPELSQAIFLVPNSLQRLTLARARGSEDNSATDHEILALELLTQSRVIPGFTDRYPRTSSIGSGSTNWVESIKHSNKS